MQWLHKILALAVICAAGQAEECPSTCYCTSTRLECSQRTLPNNNLTKAIISQYNITTTFVWTYSKINSIEKKLFSEIQHLKSIDLSGNELKTTKDDPFDRLSHLVYLNISRNAIVDLPRFTFLSLQNLTVLDVSHNSLTVIPFQLFRPMTKLEYLDLSYNTIATFIDYSFNPNRQLKSLFLNNNKLVKITSNALVNLTELETLDLSHNCLDYIPKGIFDIFDKLTTLNLGYSNFRNISQDAFKNLKNLSDLNIGGNKLKRLPSWLFVHNKNLRTLYLEHTEITVIENTNFKGLYNLQTLYLRNNTHLRDIEPFVFQDTPAITHLDISANALTNLPSSLVSLQKLKELNIVNNEWDCDCRMTWFASWLQKSNITVQSELSCGKGYPNDMLPTLHHTAKYCTEPKVIFKTPLTLRRLQTDVLLECSFEGNPSPSITWITPTRVVYHWNPEQSKPDIFHKHGVAHDEYYNHIDNSKSRVRVLENGSLFVGDIHREDSGVYFCFASNPSANLTEQVVLNIDPITMYEIKIYSLIFGALCAAAFLGLTLLVQALRYIFHRYLKTLLIFLYIFPNTTCCSLINFYLFSDSVSWKRVAVAVLV